MAFKYNDMFKGVQVKMPVDITLNGKLHRGLPTKLVYRQCYEVSYTTEELSFIQVVNGCRVKTSITGDMTKWEVVID